MEDFGHFGDETGLFFEMEQERYEEPDYNVWETDRVYEDMALERAEAEADAQNDADREDALLLRHEDHAARGENHWFTCVLCDDEDEDA